MLHIKHRRHGRDEVGTWQRVGRRMYVSLLTLTAIGVVWGARVAEAADPHQESNAVYRLLVSEGVSIGLEKTFPLPAATMPDDATAEEQKRILNELTGNALDRYIRRSTVAPHICRLQEVHSDESGIVRGVDYYFIAYADLDAMASNDFLSGLESASSAEQDEDQAFDARALSEEELAARKIALAPPATATGEATPEGYGQAKFRVLNRIELNVVGRAFWSRSDQSVVAAFMVDDRFTEDAEFPLQWRQLLREPNGDLVAGQPQVYQGAGSYIKTTQLHEPAGALLVEGHLVYFEPQGWFDGRNQLRSKIPAIVQTQVRSARREMAKASRDTVRR